MIINKPFCRSIKNVCFFILASVLISPLSVLAQPANPDDARQLMRREYSSDPAGTDQYYLEQYFALDVVISEFIFPSVGYASIIFSTVDQPDIEYRADTQLVSHLKEEKIEKKFLKKGGRAVLYGWPKTSKNKYDSIMLVDEIELIKSNGKNVFAKFHGDKKGIKNGKSECDLCLVPDSNIDQSDQYLPPLFNGTNAYRMYP